MCECQQLIVGVCAVDLQLRRLVCDAVVAAGLDPHPLRDVAAATHDPTALAALFCERDPFDTLTAHAVAAFRKRHPAAPVLLYVTDPDRDAFETVVSEAVRVPGVTFRVRHHASQEASRIADLLRALLDEAPVWHALSVMEGALGRIPPLIRDLLRAGLPAHAAGADPSVHDLSAKLGVSARTLERRAARANLPAPKELLKWGRLLLELRILAWGGVGRLAAACGPRTGNELTLGRLREELTGIAGPCVDPELDSSLVARALGSRLAGPARP
jgi:AraC-like DNA-binding protein